MLRCSAAFIDWTRAELGDIDRKTRKVMNMNNALHPKDSAARLYLISKEGGRGLLSVEGCVDQAVLEFKNYLRRSEERLKIAARSGNEIDRERVEDFMTRKRKERSVELREKALNSQHFRKAEKIASKET